MDIPTTYADLTAAGWFPGAGPTGYRFRSIVIGGYEIMVHTDGGGVSLERNDGAIQISEADTVALATKIAALLRGETSADTAIIEANATNLRLAGELAQAQVERDHWLRVAQGAEAEAAAANSQTIAKLKADLAKAQADADRRKQVIGEAHEALDAAGIGVGIPAHRIGLLLAENAALRARIAERPAPADPRDPPVESEVEACWALLEEENPEARKWDSLNGALQNTLINLRAELRRAEGQLARAKAKAHTLLDEAIEGEDGT